ncbi:MAG: hypothetical protein ACI9N3_000769 [Colwellia sp.]
MSIGMIRLYIIIAINKDFQLEADSNSSSSLKLNAANKVIQSETAKLITKKIFGWLEKRIQKSKFDRAAEQILQSIFIPDLDHAHHKFIEKYLYFRMISSASEDVFVGDIYHPINLLKQSQKKSSHIYELSEILCQSKISCFIGRAGQGKTTALRKAVLDILEKDDKHTFIPFIINLRDVDWEEEARIDKLLAKELSYFGFNIIREQSAYLLQEGVVKILFDGFDEVESKYHRIASNVINETYSRFNTSCIVTTRPNTPITYASSHTTNYEFLDLTISDVISIIKKYKNIDDNYKESLIQSVEKSESIAKILISPVMVDIYIYVYPELIEEPKNIVDFYRPLFDLITSKHDRLKGAWKRHTVSNTSNLELKEIFSALCFHSIAEENSISVTEFEFIALCSKALKTIGRSELATDEVVEDILQRTSLIQQDGLIYYYIHKSICEYYAAEFIRQLPDTSKIKFYEKLAIKNQEKFKNVLKFLSEIDSPFFYAYYAKKCLEISHYERNRHHKEFKDWHIAVLTSTSQFEFSIDGSLSIFKSAFETEGASLFFLLEILGLNFPDVSASMLDMISTTDTKLLLEAKKEYIEIDKDKSLGTISCLHILSLNQDILDKYLPILEDLTLKLDGVTQQNKKYETHLSGKKNIIDDMFN